MLVFEKGSEHIANYLFLVGQNLCGTRAGEGLVVLELIEVFFEVDEGGLGECGS